MATTTVLTSITTYCQKANAGALGDTFLLADGIYDHTSRESIVKGGVICKAQNKGKAIIKGAPIDMKAQAVEWRDFGLQYNGGSEQTVVGIYNPDCKFTGNTCNFANTITTRQDWFNIRGGNTLFQDNEVYGKKGQGNMILVGVGSLVTPNCKILNNHLHDQGGGTENGAEMIRLGSSTAATQIFNTEIAGNLIENHNTSDTELITVKSCGNDIHNNTIKNCKASPTLRHGRNNKFRDNEVYGCGVRMYGKGHTVTGNKFIRDPLNQLRQIVVGNGEWAEEEQNTNAGYTQVRDLLFQNNYIDAQDSTDLFVFCWGYDSARALKPVNNKIIGNTILASKGILANTHDGASWTNNEISNNILWPTGTAKAGDMPTSGYVVKDPNAPIPTPLTLEERVAALESRVTILEGKI